MVARKYPPVEVGSRYGRLTVVERAPKTSRHARWRCTCDCGNESTPLDFSLSAGKSTSCGCVAAEKAKARWANATPEMYRDRADNAPNKSHGMSKHRAFKSWSDMKARCLNQKHKWYPTYGGRGITVCERWLSFEVFWRDIGSSWFPGAQIGRIDNNGNYEPHNVRWETAAQQQSNKSNNVLVDTEAGRMTVSQASRMYGVPISCISNRLKAGYPQEKLFTPSQRNSK